MRIALITTAVALALPVAGTAVASADVGTISEYPIPTANSTPRGITTGPDGRLWFTESYGNKIGRITTAGVIGAGDEIALPTANVTPSGITAGPDGNLWFTEFAGGANSRIGRIPPAATSSGDVLEIPVPTANSSPEGITAGPDARIWFTEYGSLNGGRIGVLATNATTTTDITEFDIAGGGVPGPFGIVNGPDGKLWFSAFSKGTVGRITPPGASIPTTDQFAVGSPLGITLGPDGNLWAADQGGKIARITPAGVVTEFPTLSAGSQPFGIAAGPDGRIWFTEAGGTTNHIGVMTTDGVMTAADEYTIPTDGANPLFITAGPDGRMWFTESNGGKVGAITTGVASPSGSFTLTVSKAGPGTGTVTSQPAGITCGATCSSAYGAGTSVTLSAAPDSGSTFAGWSGDCSGSSTCTVSMSQARAVTATFSAAGSGSPPGPLVGVGCAANKLILTDVFPKGATTRMLGVAPAGSAGKRVAIIATWNRKVVARVKVKADLTFTASAPLPPARLRFSNRARYVAKLGSKRSSALKFARRMYTTAVTNQGRSITFSGTVTRPLDKPPQAVTIRASASCSAVASGTVVATVKPSSSGAFTARFELPAGLTTAFLRAQTRVRKHPGAKTTFPTFTLVRGIRLAP